MEEWTTAVRRWVEDGELLNLCARLEPYQAEYLRDRAMTRCVLKSRQVGFSWVFAAEAVVRALFEERSLTLFVSLNEREAREKVRYAEAIHDALPRRLRGTLLSASRDGLEWANGSRVVSFPCRAPRGYSGASVVLDEMAFYPDDRAVYEGALPVVSRGGRLTVASSPFGARGVFWEQVERFRRGSEGFHYAPWWRCSWMVNAAAPRPDALRPAEGSPDPLEEMDTEERVARYGSVRLRAIRAAMNRDGFRQEYECQPLEETDAWISHEELMPCVRGGLEVARSLDDWEVVAQCDAGGAGPLFAGYDVGRSVHPSELVLLERDNNGVLVARALVTLRNAPFEAQHDTLRRLLRHPRLTRLALDATGMGAPLAEGLAREHPLRVEPVTFTAAMKERLAVGLKVALSKRQIALPADRELLAQIRSIRRVAGEGGRSRYEAAPGGLDETGGRTHGDRFWALALAWRASESAATGPLVARRLGA